MEEGRGFDGGGRLTKNLFQGPKPARRKGKRKEGGKKPAKS